MDIIKRILTKKKGKLLLPFTIFGLFGLIIEIFFTAITGNMVGYFGLTYFSFAGRSSILMIFVYGLGGTAISIINEFPKYFRMRMIYQTIIGGILVSIIELITGILLNIFPLQLNIWNYSGQPNILGQVCLTNAILFMLGIPAFIWLIDFISWALYRELWHYNILDNYKDLFTGK